MKLMLLIALAHALCASSSVLYSISDELCEKAKQLLKNDLSIYQISSINLDNKFLPEIGNGHIGTQIKKEWFFVNGLYNGYKTESQRARIPSTLNWNLKIKDKLYQRIISLDSLIGIVKETFIFSHYNISISTFVSRINRQIVVRNVSLETSQKNESVTLFTTDTDVNFTSPDINFIVTKLGNISMVEGWTQVPENNYTTKLPIHLIFEQIPNMITLQNSRPWISFITAIDSDKTKTQKSFNQALTGKSTLLYQHAKAWIETWDDGLIQITKGDTFLIQSVHTAQYYILSSLPYYKWWQTEPRWEFYGLSPEGLAHGDDVDDYKGHIFWDMDMWIFPAVLPFHRDSAIEMLKYRIRMLPSAVQHSDETGYRGARYPWESALTGFETSPSKACSDKEIHVSADISFAGQQLLWIESKLNYTLYTLFGKSIIENVARFWASRISFNFERLTFDILDVMPPDEYVHSCNNSAFTNMAAKLALQMPLLLAKKFKGEINAEMKYWFSLGSNLSYPSDRNKKLILEHESYKMGTLIKQADVALLFYPLQIQIPREDFINSQSYYEKVTDNNGPAMTWAIYSINWFKLQNIEKAVSLFLRNYRYINLPFYVWSECENGTGAINFHTGIGGYLQNILNGFMGMRLDFSDSGRLIFRPSVTKIIPEIMLHNIKFQNSNFDIKLYHTSIVLTLLNDVPLNIFCVDNSISYNLNPSERSLAIDNQEIIITSAG